MALIAFPAKFGKPFHMYKVQAVDPVLRTEMERGIKSRNAFESARFNYVLQFYMTNEQQHYFQAWWRWKIDNGAAWFDMPARVNGATTTLEARPLAYVEAEPVGNNRHWLVSITCETRTDGIPTESALNTWISA